MRITYIGNIRLPTEKAHGFQIMKMCEALAGAGAEVELWHPRRRQTDELSEVSPFDYYEVERRFAVRSLGNVDVFAAQKLLPGRAFAAAFYLHSIGWAWAAARAAASRGGFCYTRDPVIAYWCTRAALPTFFEAHVIPARLGRRFLRAVAAHPKLVGYAGVTTYIVGELRGLGFDHDGIVLPDAVDLVRFGDLPSRAACRDRTGLPPERPVVGYVGRFSAMGLEKGIRSLVDAVALLRQREPRPLLVCVGGPMDDVASYAERAGNLGLSSQDVRFVDRVPTSEVPYWIRACDVVTIPWPATRFSSYFTSPLKLFEYMAASTPIVASDLPALRDVLEHGRNCLLAKPGDPEELAAGIARLLDDPPGAETLAGRARDDVQGYTWERRARTVLDVMERSS